MATRAREAVRWVLKGLEAVGGGGGWIVSVSVRVRASGLGGGEDEWGAVGLWCVAGDRRGDDGRRGRYGGGGCCCCCPLEET